jgi:hypothetical protein
VASGIADDVVWADHAEGIKHTNLGPGHPNRATTHAGRDSAMLDWYLLSEADFLLATHGSDFSGSAAARGCGGFAQMLRGQGEGMMQAVYGIGRNPNQLACRSECPSVTRMASADCKAARGLYGFEHGHPADAGVDDREL